jgi:hypothetical protein
MSEMPKTKKFDYEKYALSGSEDAQQIALFAWAWEMREKYPELDYMYAIPNGGFRTRSEAARLRAMGVKEGVPDLCLPVKRGVFSGLYVEMKRPALNGKKKGYAKLDQKRWIKFLISQGYGACVCVGFENAKAVITQYLEHK